MDDAVGETSSEFIRIKPTEITEDNFEDLLAIDDVLLDYFNAYLALPVFSHSLYYNRLTGTFLHRPHDDAGKLPNGNGQADEGVRTASSHAQQHPQQQRPPYGATDEESERMMQWAKDERLPMFFRTRLFREYKLCRLLLRLVDDRRGTASLARVRHSAAADFRRRLSAPAKSASSGTSRRQSSTASSLVRGYSRQTAETFSASSLSNSAGNSGAKDDPDDDDVDDDDTTTAATTTDEVDDSLEQQIATRRSTLFGYLRPGSQPVLDGPSGHAIIAKSDRFRDDVRVSQLMQPMETTVSSGTGATKPSKLQVGGNEHQPNSSSDPQLNQQLRRRRLETSSEETNNNNDDQLEFSDAMTSAFDESLDSEAFRLVLPETILELRLKSHTGNNDQHHHSSSDSSVTEFPAIVTPRKMKYYDVLYEDVDTEEHDPDALMTSAAFAGDVISDAQTEDGVRSLEVKHRMSLQGMKELVLGTVSGMNNFRQFLQLTVGRHLYDFWLDCEFYKDTVEDLDDDHHRLLRNRLFKNIQEKYKLSLSRDAVQQFMQAASHFGLKQTIFTHAQYSILRRLRAYWVPRYLIHLERINELGIGLSSDVHQRATGSVASPNSVPTGIFPSLTVVDNLPASSSTSANGWLPLAERDITSLDRPTVSGTTTRVTSAGDESSRQVTASASVEYHRVAKLQQQTGAKVCNSLRDRFLSALRNEKEAGGPLQLYLQRCDELDLLCNLLFWQEVTEYQSAEVKSSDKATRASFGWDVFNKYLSADAFFSIGLPHHERLKIHRKLQTGQQLVNSDVFHAAQEHAERLLEDAWIGYVKQDFKTYLDCGLRTQQTPPSKASDFEVKFNVATQQLIVEVVSTTRQDAAGESDEPSDRCEMSEAQRAILRRKRLERRKIMERERRKAIRAAKIRLKEAKMKARGVMLGVKADGSMMLKDDDDSEAGLYDIVENPTFHTALVHKRVMSSFKKHLNETQSKDVLNAVSLFTDIEAYNNISGSDAQAQKKKTELAMHIGRQYLAAGAKKKISNGLVMLADWTSTSVKDRPKSPLLRKLQSQLQPTIDASFTSYCSTEEFNSRFRTSPSKNRYQRADQEVENPESISESKTDESRGGVVLPVLPGASPSPVEVAGYNPFLQQQLAFPSTSSMSDRPPWEISVDDALFDVMSEVAGTRHAQTMDVDNTKPAKKTDASVHVPRTSDVNKDSTVKTKMSNRVHPTKADKADFLNALQSAATGHLPVRMWLFYEFLVYHGELEGNSRLDKNLFFYCEVLKFKEASHMFADEELLRRKVQSMSECYIEPVPTTTSSVQIDISAEIQQKTLKAVQKYLAGKDYSSTMFDEAQSSSFKEMLPYWVYFNRSYAPPSGNRPIPLTKQLRDRRRKLEEILRWSPQIPQTIVLPLLTKGTASSNSFTYSLSDGFRWKSVATSNGDDRSSSRGAAAAAAGGGKRTPLAAVDEVPESADSVSGSRVKKTSSASRMIIDLPSISNHAILIAQA